MLVQGKKVIINGAEYNAEKTNEIGNEYKVKIGYVWNMKLD